MELFFLRPFDLLARRVDSRYRIQRVHGLRLGWLEYAGIMLLGFLSSAFGLGLIWLVSLVAWLVGGLLDPVIWRRIYGTSGRGTSLVANLDVPYLFTVGWVIASLLL
jgi:hypothetical protein